MRALVEAHGPPAELATRGFRWEVETDAAGRNPKAGYVGRGEGDLLALPFILPLPSSGGADEADASHAAAGGLGLDRPTGDRPTGDRPTGERADAARADAAQARPPLGKAMVGLLRSWASGMGVAAVSCHGSCTCARCERAQSGCALDGHIRRGKKLSVTQQLIAHVRPRAHANASATCWLAVRTLAQTSSGGHKLKVVSLVTRGVRASVHRR